MARKPTIWECLVAKLGRNPTNEECKQECLRILNDAMTERAIKQEKKGN